MLALTVVMCIIMGYQVSMPQVDNAKYTLTVYDDKIVRMNTQNGEFEVCDKEFKCEKVISPPK